MKVESASWHFKQVKGASRYFEQGEGEYCVSGCLDGEHYSHHLVLYPVSAAARAPARPRHRAQSNDHFLGIQLHSFKN